MKTLQIPVRILTSMVQCLPSGMFRDLEKGNIVDWDAEDAKRLFAAGYAQPMDMGKTANFTATK